MRILSLIRDRFLTALAPLTTEPHTLAVMVRPAQDTRFGDFQANCAMPLGKQLGRKPADVARELVAALKVDDICEPVDVAGPGFINLKLRSDWLAAQTEKLIQDDRLGVAAVSEPQTYVVDFSAPNVAKPMHVGHLRSTVIGAALCRILRFYGHRVIGDNHIGDWGTQFGMIIFGYKNFLDADAFADSPVDELARLYRLVSQLSDYHETRANLPKLDGQLADKLQELGKQSPAAEAGDKAAEKARKKATTDLKNLQEAIASGRRKMSVIEANPQLQQQAAAFPDIAERARQETAKLHAGDPENRALWHRFLPACLNALNRLYDRLGVTFDYALGESYYDTALAEVVQDLQEKGLARESEGAICVFTSVSEAPFIVRKSDGAFTYATSDLATIQHRVREWKADVILYVVDVRQGDHFQQLFETARRWGFDQTRFHHVSFGTILGEDRRPFKTRAGDTVGLESLLDEAVSEALKTVTEEGIDFELQRRPDLTAEEKQRVAEVVGLGGIKYADLKHNRESDYVFSWEKMLAKTGDTAPYLQYAFARVAGILRKGGVDRAALRAAGGSIVIDTPQERALCFQLCRYADLMDEVLVDFRPNLLTEYLYQTANLFSAFFENCPVLQAETPELRTSRLLLSDLTARIIEHGLDLLGIEAIEKM